MNSTHPPGHGTDDPRRRLFVVSCPACSSETHLPAGSTARASQSCSVCSGLGRVPRVIAERYNLSLRSLPA